jgi:hypothetical protein
MLDGAALAVESGQLLVLGSCVYQSSCEELLLEQRLRRCQLHSKAAQVGTLWLFRVAECSVCASCTGGSAGFEPL